MNAQFTKSFIIEHNHWSYRWVHLPIYLYLKTNKCSLHPSYCAEVLATQSQNRLFLCPPQEMYGQVGEIGKEVKLYGKTFPRVL